MILTAATQKDYALPAALIGGTGLASWNRSGAAATLCGFFVPKISQSFYVGLGGAPARVAGRFSGKANFVQSGSMISLLVSGLKPLLREAAMNTNTQISPAALKISDISIRQDAEGRYCLNDLHKAAGNDIKHKPANFLQIQQTQDLIAELEKDDDGIPSSKDDTRNPVSKIQGRGKQQGTYVVKELVYSYAMWISASFSLKVIRAYDALATGQSELQGKPEPKALDAAQLTELIRSEITNALPMTGYLLPPQQAKEITERLDRLGQMFHPLSTQFGDVLGIGRALRGLHPNLGIQEPSYRRVIEHPADHKIRG